MEEKNNQQKKEITLENLALMMTKGFEKSNKQTDEKIETLAVLVQDGFLSIEERLGGVEGKLDGVEGRLDGVEGRLDRIETNIKEIKSDTEDIKAEINKKVDKITHNDLKYRVEKLEKKFA